jgi:hypothetical protein
MAVVACGLSFAVAPAALAVADSAEVSSFAVGPVSGTATTRIALDDALMIAGFPAADYTVPVMSPVCASAGITVTKNGSPVIGSICEGFIALPFGSSLYNGFGIYGGSPAVLAGDVVTITWGRQWWRERMALCQ